MHRAMLRAMRRRTLPEPLKPTNAPTWLVVRDGLNHLVESRQLPPGTELRAVLVATREQRIAAGWSADEIGRTVSFFFCARDGERHMVSIEYRQPGSGLGAW
jgi:hypothetical protein